MSNVVRLAFILACAHASAPRQRVGPRLQDVPTLVFFGPKLINTKRGSDSVPSQHAQTHITDSHLDQVVCLNNGTSTDGHVIWDCTPYGLPKDHTFITEAVRCEGLNGPDDERIVQGSCVLEYRIERTVTSASVQQNAMALAYASEMAFAYLFWRALSTVLGFTFDMNASGLLFGLTFIFTFNLNARGLLFALITVCVRLV